MTKNEIINLVTEKAKSSAELSDKLLLENIQAKESESGFISNLDFAFAIQNSTRIFVIDLVSEVMSEILSDIEK